MSSPPENGFVRRFAFSVFTRHARPILARFGDRHGGLSAVRGPGVQGGLRRMRKIALENFGWHLASDLTRTIHRRERAVRGALEHRQSSRWRPVSTAPYNRDLELRVAEDGSVATMPFPCRHTNGDEWINVDLGVALKIQPLEWRAWRQSDTSQAYGSSIFAPATLAARRIGQWMRLC
jgi:hypothetical protein